MVFLCAKEFVLFIFDKEKETKKKRQIKEREISVRYAEYMYTLYFNLPAVHDLEPPHKLPRQHAAVSSFDSSILGFRLPLIHMYDSSTCVADHAQQSPHPA